MNIITVRKRPKPQSSDLKQTSRSESGLPKSLRMLVSIVFVQPIMEIGQEQVWGEGVEIQNVLVDPDHPVCNNSSFLYCKILILSLQDLSSNLACTGISLHIHLLKKKKFPTVHKGDTSKCIT